MCGCCSKCRKRGICTGTDWYDSACPKVHDTCKLRRENQDTSTEVSLAKYKDFVSVSKGQD